MSDSTTNTPAEHWETLAHAGRIDDALVAYVAERQERSRDGACWNHVVDDFETYIPTRGHQSLDIAHHVFLHANMSPEFTEIILRLIRAKRLAILPVSYFELMFMGGSFYTAPLATAHALEHGGYKTGDHWAPSVLVLPTNPDLLRMQQAQATPREAGRAMRKQPRGSADGRRKGPRR